MKRRFLATIALVLVFSLSAAFREKVMGAWRKRFGDRGISRKLNDARFAQVLEMGLASGLPLEEAAEICAALLRREKTGEGDTVRSGLFHNSIFTMGTMAITSQPPFGRVYPEDRAGWGAPQGDYECADGEWIFISGYTSVLYGKLYRVLGREDLETDPRFATAEARWENRQLYYEIVRDAFLQKPSTYCKHCE